MQTATVRPGFFGDETGDVAWWDGERWNEPQQDRDLVPAAEREQRLAAQLAAFERAGYRVTSRGPQSATVVRSPQRRWWRQSSAAPEHRVVISIDRAGAVRFA